MISIIVRLVLVRSVSSRQRDIVLVVVVVVSRLIILRAAIGRSIHQHVAAGLSEDSDASIERWSRSTSIVLNDSRLFECQNGAVEL